MQVYVHIYTCIHIISMYVCVYVRMYVFCMYVCVNEKVCMHMYVHRYMCMYLRGSLRLSPTGFSSVPQGQV